MPIDITAKIVVADDHPLFRGALRQAIASLMPNAKVLETCGLEGLNGLLARERDVDLILLDLTMPGVQGFSGLVYLRSQHPETPVIIVSATEDASVIRRAIGFGASGFMPKSLEPESMGDAIQSVLAGDIWVPPSMELSEEEDQEAQTFARRLASLTPQQLRVLMMLSDGLLNKQIAYELSVSEATVKAHVSAILQKLDVDSRTQAAIAASRINVSQRPAMAFA